LQSKSETKLSWQSHIFDAKSKFKVEEMFSKHGCCTYRRKADLAWKGVPGLMRLSSKQVADL